MIYLIIYSVIVSTVALVLLIILAHWPHHIMNRAIKIFGKELDEKIEREKVEC